MNVAILTDSLLFGETMTKGSPRYKFKVRSRRFAEQIKYNKSLEGTVNMHSKTLKQTESFA